MFLPSGDQWPSKCGVSRFGSNRFRSEPSAFTVHRAIFPWWMRVNRIFPPSGDHCKCCLNDPSAVTRTGESAQSGAAVRTTRKAATRMVGFRLTRITRASLLLPPLAGPVAFVIVGVALDRVGAEEAVVDQRPG